MVEIIASYGSIVSPASNQPAGRHFPKANMKNNRKVEIALEDSGAWTVRLIGDSLGYPGTAIICGTMVSMVDCVLNLGANWVQTGLIGPGDTAPYDGGSK